MKFAETFVVHRDHSNFSMGSMPSAAYCQGWHEHLETIKFRACVAHDVRTKNPSIPDGGWGPLGMYGQIVEVARE